MGVILADRSGLAAADGAPVVGPAFTCNTVESGLLTTFSYSTTGGPATINVRAKIEVSTDGSNWHDLVRFIDQTTTGGAVRIARLQLLGTAAESGTTQTALTTVAAAAVLSDGAIGTGVLMRAHTMLQALTGGASPTARILVSAAVEGS